MTCLKVYPVKSLLDSTQLQNASFKAIKQQQEKSHFSLYFQDVAEIKLLNRVSDICKRLNYSKAKPGAPLTPLLQRPKVTDDNRSQKLRCFLSREAGSRCADTTSSHILNLTGTSPGIFLAIDESLCKSRQKSYH